MRTHLTSSIVAGAIMLAILSVEAIPVAAQSATAARTNAFKRTPDGKPDLSGIWMPPHTRNMAATMELPFTPAGKAAWDDAKVNQIDPTSYCHFPGIPRTNNTGYPVEIYQSPTRVAFLYEYMNIWRSVPTDGSDHPKDVEPTFMGHAVGRWEGDTLVIDAIGFNDRTWLDSAGHQHSDQLHVIERFWRIDEDHLGYEVTVDDPKMYSKPWKNSRVFTKENVMIEYSCNENNRSRDENLLQKGAK